MSEQTCEHNYSGGIWTVTLRNGDMIVDAHGCPDCLTRLEEGGTETRMVPAVTPEVVRAMRFMQVLDSYNRTDAEFDALVELGFLIEDKGNRRGDAVRFYDNAPDLEIIFAALSQATGLAAAEHIAMAWARDELRQSGNARLRYVDGAIESVSDEVDEEEVRRLAATRLSAALAAVGEEPGPSDKPEEDDHARD